MSFQRKTKEMFVAENNLCKYETTTKKSKKQGWRRGQKLCQLKIRNVTKLTGDTTQGNKKQCQRVPSKIETTVPLLTESQE